MYSTTNAGFPASPNTNQLHFPEPTQSVIPASPDTDTALDTVTVQHPDAQPDADRDMIASPDPDSDTIAMPDGCDITGQDRLTELPDVIEFCKRHGFPADVVGRWVWIRFDEKPDARTRDLLKGAGFRWVKIRGQWAHNCGYHSRRGKGNPRWKYGSVPVSAITRDEIASLKGAAL